MRFSIFLISQRGRACCDAACPHPLSDLTSMMRRGRGDQTRCLIATSRLRFGRPRAEVEARISKFLGNH